MSDKIPTVCMFLDANRYSCLRISVGQKLTHFIAIPEGAEPFEISNISTERFNERFIKPEPNYPISRLADHYLSMASIRGASDKVRNILSIAKKENTVSEQSAAAATTADSKNKPNWANPPAGGDAKPAKKSAKSNGAKKAAPKKEAKAKPAKAKPAAPKPGTNVVADALAAKKASKGKPKAKAAAKGKAKASTSSRTRYGEDQKFKVEVDNTREGTHMKTMMEAAAELKKFTRAELLNKIERKLDKDSPGRSARFFSWALGHGLFAPA